MTLTKSQSISSFLLFTAGLVLAEIWAVKAGPALTNLVLFSWAVTTDFIIGIPLLYFIFVTRKKLLPHLTLIPVFYLSIRIAEHVLPPSYHPYHLEPINSFLDFIVPIGELIVFAFIAYRVRGAIQRIRAHKQKYQYVTDAIEQSVPQVLTNPFLGRLLTIEISTFYYALAGWFISPLQQSPNHQYYSYHRKTGYAAIVGVLLISIAVETVAFHLLISIWSETAAWIVSALSIYSFFWLIGDLQAMRHQPIILSPSQLHIRLGLRSKGVVSISNITKLKDAKRPIDKTASGYINCVAWGAPNLIIDLNTSVSFTHLFGKKIEVSRIGICIDEKESFKRAIERSIASC